MERWLIGPLRAVHIVAILRKTTEVYNAKVGRARWPAIWCRLTKIVETCPYKLTDSPRLVIMPKPVVFRQVRPTAMFHIVR